GKMSAKAARSNEFGLSGRKMLAVLPVLTLVLLCGVFQGAPTTLSQTKSAIALSRSGRASASGPALLRVHRNLVRDGGWEFTWKSPKQNGDGYAYGDAQLQFQPDDVIQTGCTVPSAVPNREFAELCLMSD